MTAPFVGQKLGGPSGRTDIDVLPRDFLIDKGCKALFDFGYQWGYPAQVTPAVNGSQVRAYPYAAANSAIAGAPTWTGKMLNFAAKGQNVSLPVADWGLAASATNFVIGGFAKIPMTGYPSSGSGTALAGGVFGYLLSNGANAQYNLYPTYNAATGALVAVYAALNGVQFDVTSYIPTDGAVHHYALEFRKIDSATWQAFFYVDGVLVFASSAQAYSGSIVVPAGGLCAIGSPATGVFVTALVSVGRLWLWDLTVSGSKTVTALIAADITQNSGRFS